MNSTAAPRDAVIADAVARPRRSAFAAKTTTALLVAALGIAAVSARTAHAAPQDAAKPQETVKPAMVPPTLPQTPPPNAPVSSPMRAAMTPLTPVTALPTSVLLFPPDIEGENGDVMAAASITPAMREAQRIVTDGLRTMLERGKIGIVVYNRRLPSMQRAISEGVKPEAAAMGPGDDKRTAQRFANILGANEYLVTSIDSYKYDNATRTVTFNLSMFRYNADGTQLGTTVVKAIGTAPADILGAHQEAFADEAAAQVASDQVAEGVYPQIAAILNPPKEMMKKRHGRKIGGIFLVPVVAVGAALIGPHT